MGLGKRPHTPTSFSSTQAQCWPCRRRPPDEACPFTPSDARSPCTRTSPPEPRPWWEFQDHPRPPQSPLNTLFLLYNCPAACVCPGCEGLGQRPWEGGRSNTSWLCDLGQDTQISLVLKMGPTITPTVAVLAACLQGKSPTLSGMSASGKIRPRPATPRSGCRGRPLPGNSPSLAWSNPRHWSHLGGGWGLALRLGVGPRDPHPWRWRVGVSTIVRPCFFLLVGLTLVPPFWVVRSCSCGGPRPCESAGPLREWCMRESTGDCGSSWK